MRKRKFTVAAIVLVMALLFTYSAAIAQTMTIYDYVTGNDGEGSCAVDQMIKFDELGDLDFTNGCIRFIADTNGAGEPYESWVTPVRVWTKAGNEGKGACPNDVIECVGDTVSTNVYFDVTLLNLSEGVWTFEVCANDAPNGLSHWLFQGSEPGKICVTKKDTSENLLPDWEFTLEGPCGYVETQTTGVGGTVCWDNLSPGDYTITETQQNGWEAVSPTNGTQDVTLSEGDTENITFVNQMVEPGKICGHKYLDGELKNGWNIYLYAGEKDSTDELGSGDNFVVQATTADGGSFCFTGLDMDITNYFLYEESQNGISADTPDNGYFDNIAPVAEDATEFTNYDFYNATITEPGKICGHKYLDDELKNGWNIYLYAGEKDSTDELGFGDNFVAQATTTDGGSFCFTGLDMEITNYFLYEESRNGISADTPDNGYFDNIALVLENATDTYYDFYNKTDDEGDDDNNDNDSDNDNDGGNGGDATGEGVTPEVLTVPSPQTPQAPPIVPAPVKQPIVVPVEAPMAPAELPFTGGDPMAFAYAGFVLTALGTALRRKFK